MKSISNIFPSYGSKNVKLYYVLSVFINAAFILPNWVFYFAQFISIPAIGLIDGLSKLVAVVFEVPSGAVSDLFGKKRTLILGNLLFATCCIILINVSTFTGLLIGNLVMFLGFAFISGSKEALLYDSLLDINKEDEYDNVLGKVSTINIVSMIATIFMGGLLYRINPELTFWAWFAFNIISVLILSFMKEPKADEEGLSYRHYFSKLQTGTKSIFQHSFIKFVLPVLFFSMLFKSYEGVIRQNTGAYFGFTGETFGYLLALVTIPALFMSYNFGKISKKYGDKTQYIFIGLYTLGFLIVYMTNNLYFGILSFTTVYMAQELAKPFITSLVNKRTASKHRATALSTVSLFSEIPYMIIVIFFGSLIEVDSIRILYLFFVLSLSAYLIVRKLKKQKLN